MRPFAGCRAEPCLSILALLLALFSFALAGETVDFDAWSKDQKIVVATKRIVLEEYPGAYNPSLIEYGEGYLLTFRYNPDFYGQPWTSYIGVVLLNRELDPVSEPQLLNTRSKSSKTPSQAEDARIFSYRGKTMLIYNDNIDVNRPSYWDRRDMFIAELRCQDGLFSLSPPLKLVHQEKYPSVLWQKNWVPFEWNKTLFISYSVNPHEVLYPNLMNGECYRCYESEARLDWDLGHLKLSSPPILVDGEYLAFFHSWKVVSSEASWGYDLYHYFIGAYTFSANPPFKMTRYTPDPIVAEGFYTQGSYIKRVIFPGTFALSGNKLLLPYGKDDSEIWIATFDLKALKDALKEIP